MKMKLIVTEINHETEIDINNLEIMDWGKFEEYIGQIIEIESQNILCRFLRRSQRMLGCFAFPFIIDEAYVSIDQIVKKLKIIKERRRNYQFE